MVLKTFPHGKTETDHFQQFLTSLLYLSQHKYESGKDLFNGVGHLAACFYSQGGFEALVRAHADYSIVFTDMIDRIKANHHIFLKKDKTGFKQDLSDSFDDIDELLAPAEIAMSGYNKQEKEDLKSDVSSSMISMSDAELLEMAVEFIELPNIEKFQRDNNGLILK